MRIGEALALAPADFEVVGYTQHQKTTYADRLENDTTIFQVAVTKTLIKTDMIKVLAGTKNHKDRFIPLPTQFQNLFQEYMLYRMEIVKPAETEKRLFTYTPTAVHYALKRYCELSGIKKHSLHDFRHTYISNLVALGLPVSDVAEFSGDSEQTILQTYVHATEDYKLRLLNKLNVL